MDWLSHDPSSCAGVDEVGRGCLFGPVFAAAVVLSSEALSPLLQEGLSDSKKLTASHRDRLVPLIKHWCLAWGMGQASSVEIDRYGIRSATEYAMVRALQRLPSAPHLVLIDGPWHLRLWSGEQHPMVRGDLRCPSIAAASVLAKQERDALIRRLAVQVSGYGLERHVGYGTPQHCEALRRLGPTSLHRRSFLRSPGTRHENPPATASPPST